MYRMVKALLFFLASGAALAAEPVSLTALVALMDRVEPAAEDGWSIEVTNEVCAGFDPQGALRERSSLLLSVEEKKVGGKVELHVSRTVWFLRHQKLVVSGYHEGNCVAWIYVKPLFS